MLRYQLLGLAGLALVLGQGCGGTGVDDEATGPALEAPADGGSQALTSTPDDLEWRGQCRGQAQQCQRLYPQACYQQNGCRLYRRGAYPSCGGYAYQCYQLRDWRQCRQQRAV